MAGKFGFAVLMALAAAAMGQSLPGPETIPTRVRVKLKEYESPYHLIYTDIDETDAREAVIRMTRMAEEYAARTKGFGGTIRDKLPFYLFSDPDDYSASGGIPGSVGLFTGTCLMAEVLPGMDEKIGPQTWHVVQHEGFHRFAHAVMGGQLPTWADEGLAEYFGEAVFTGDGFVTGVIPPARFARIKQTMKRPEGFKSLDGMMHMTLKEWNGALAIINYDQGWSMVHFLAHGDGGKYQDAFSKFMGLVGRGHGWEQAWKETFGSTDGFEQRWREWYLGLSNDPTADLYAKATVATLTSFLARAYGQNQKFETLDAFLDTDPGQLKSDVADWLPPDLFTRAVGDARRLMTKSGAQMTLAKPLRELPQVVCVLGDGTKIVGKFILRQQRVASVYAEVTKVR